MSEQQLVERFQYAAGVPRGIFDVTDNLEDSLHEAVSTTDLKSILGLRGASHSWQASGHRLFMIYVPNWREGDFTTRCVQFRSRKAAAFLWEKANKHVSALELDYRQLTPPVVPAAPAARGRKKVKMSSPTGSLMLAKMELATLARAGHSIKPGIVQTLQLLPETVQPKLYFVVGTKLQFDNFQYTSPPFYEELYKELEHSCPGEPDHAFWKAESPTWLQVPSKARKMLRDITQHVMFLDYERLAYHDELRLCNIPLLL